MPTISKVTSRDVTLSLTGEGGVYSFQTAASQGSRITCICFFSLACQSGVCADRERVGILECRAHAFLHFLITPSLLWSCKVTLGAGGAPNHVGVGNKRLQRVFGVLERGGGGGVLWQRLGNDLGNHFRRRRGASVKDEVTWVLRRDMRVKAVHSFLSNVS